MRKHLDEVELLIEATLRAPADLRRERAMNMSPQAAAVASPHAEATAVGADVLRAGGNAADAAFATNAMLGVCYPHMCGLGGDMFLLYYEAHKGIVHCLNGTGRAPALATAEKYRGMGLKASRSSGPLSVTVPGAVEAWNVALEKFGSKPVAELLEPAVRAAEGGVQVTARFPDG